MSSSKCLLLIVNSVLKIASNMCLLPVLFNGKLDMFIQYSESGILMLINVTLHGLSINIIT